MDTRSAPARPRAGTWTGTWTGVVALALGAFAVGTEGFVVAGVLGGLAADLDVGVGLAGQAVTLYALVYAAGAPALAALLGGRRLLPVLVASLALFGLGNVLAAAAPSFAALLAARTVCALAAALYVPAAGAAAAAMVPASHRGRALAVVLGGLSAATVLGAPLGIVVAGAGSWRSAFVLVAVLSALAAGALGVLRPAVGDTARTSLAARLRVLRTPVVVGSLAVTLLAMAGGYSVYTYLDPLFAPRPGIGAGALGLLVAAFGIGGVVGTSLGGTLADRWGSSRTIVTALVALTAVFALSPLVATTLAGALAFLLLWGVTGWAFVPAQQHRLVGLGPDRAALLLSLNASCVYLGIALGAGLGGAVTAGPGAGHLWLVAVTCCAAAVTVQLLVARGPALRPERAG